MKRQTLTPPGPCDAQALAGVLIGLLETAAAVAEEWSSRHSSGCGCHWCERWLDHVDDVRREVAGAEYVARTIAGSVASYGLVMSAIDSRQPVADALRLLAGQVEQLAPGRTVGDDFPEIVDAGR